jgi:uncharacterized protein YprB with RNaseH-like and TPR domain
LDAYLDIETSYDHAISVVGVYIPGLGTCQLVGGDITDVSVARLLEPATCLYTFNGHRFDLPVIRRELRLDLAQMLRTHDLLYDCWARSLYGGLKAVERRLGIERTFCEVDGRMAMTLWQRYEALGDRDALTLLLAYNREDIENLEVLRDRLAALDQGEVVPR